MSDDKTNQVAAAWVTVEPLLATKKRGDDLTRAEIAAVANGCEVRRLEQRIRDFFRRQGIDLQPIIGEGWHVPTQEEQVRERAEHHRGKAHREKERELFAAASTDEAELTPDARRLRALHVRHASLQIAAGREVEGERKAILGAPPALPRLP